MFRLLAGLLLAASVAVADSPPDRPLPPKPAEPVAALPSATVTVVVKPTVSEGAIQIVQYKSVAVQKQGTRKVQKDGQLVDQVYTYTEVVTTPTVTAYKLKDLKATGTDGKAVTGDDAEKSLMAGGAVVLHAGPLGDDLRKAFKDGTVFIDQTPAPPK